ncbi:MAG: Holliday junction branch migration protein RuvA [Actinomycetales bacterium]
MIATVRGRVTALGLDSAVVEVGGVGILVQAAPGTLAGLAVGHEATLFTSLVVREESLTLFGFLSDDERSTFETVQTVSGIGPRLALAMLAVHEPDGLRRAVATEDLVALTRVPGIGRKGAQRLVLELKDRLGAPGPAARAESVTAVPAAEGRPQVRDALVGLGWSSKAADDALDSVLADADGADAPDVAGLLRAALRQLGRT